MTPIEDASMAGNICGRRKAEGRKSPRMPPEQYGPAAKDAWLTGYDEGLIAGRAYVASMRLDAACRAHDCWTNGGERSRMKAALAAADAVRRG